MKLILFLAVMLIILSCCRQAFKRHINTNKVVKADLSQFAGALYPVKKDGKWGYIDNQLEQVIPFQFVEAGNFTEGLAPVSMMEASTQSGDKGFTSTSSAGKELYGFIDTTGKVVIDCKYDRVFPFSEGLAVIVKDSKYGFVDKTGKEVIPAQYEDAASFSEGLAAVKLDEKNGFIDKTGRMVIEPRFARACWVSEFSEGMAAVYFEDGSAGYMDKEGKLVIPAAFTYVSKFSEGLALIQPKGSLKYGYINNKGEMVIQPQYDLSLPFSEGAASVKVPAADGSYYFRVIDKTGKALADKLKYNFTGIFREGLAGVETYDYRWGFIDKTGAEVIKPVFASVRLFHNGLSMTETGSLFTKLNTGYIDKNGNEVIGETR